MMCSFKERKSSEELLSCKQNVIKYLKLKRGTRDLRGQSCRNRMKSFVPETDNAYKPVGGGGIQTLRRMDLRPPEPPSEFLPHI